MLAVDDGTTLTLGQWLRRAEHVAKVLRARAVAPGDRIALVVDDAAWIGYAVANLAVHLAGGTVVGIADRLGAQTIAARVAECRARAVVRAPAASVPDLGIPVWSVDDLEQAPEGHGEQVADQAEPDAIAEIVYTSGTTGPAKPVAVTHASLTFGRDSRGELFGGIESILCAFPPGTNAGHSSLMVALTTGSRAHVLRRITPDTVAAAIERDRIQYAILGPGTAAGLVTSEACLRYDISSLRAFMFGSSAVPDRVISALSAAVPAAQIMIGYGSTESAPAFARQTLPPWQEHGDVGRYRRAGLPSLGRPGGGTEVAIVGPGGQHLPPGEIGEIWLRGEGPRRYYLGDDPRTAGVFTADGWVRMGDLGMTTGDGELLFVDRVPDSIVTAGHQVSSAMVENALLWHPAVRAVAVFGVPEPGAGQIVVAVAEADSSPDELAGFLAGELKPADRPAFVLTVPELPRGITGKILKTRLRELYRDLAGTRSARV